MRRRIAALTAALLALPLGAVPAGAAGATVVPDTAGPHQGLMRHARCVDGPLRLTADGPLTLGTSGTIQVHRADGTLADEIDLADPASSKRTIGDAVSDSGAPHLFRYQPVIVSGNTAQITLHHQLAYGTAYYVTVDPQVFPGFAGIQDARTWRFRTRPAAPRTGTRHLTVAADGTGDFCTVQGAIDFVPEGNTHPVLIDVRPGTYTEMDWVRADRPHITVRGAGRDRTVIQYANNNNLNGDTALKGSTDPADVCPRQALPGHDTFNCWRAMFSDEAADFRLRDVTLHNTTPYGGSQAEAFRGNADRIALEHVNLDSFQDTLRLQGRGYVSDSYIEGDVDFIWGTGSVYIARSELKSLHAGYVTQARNDATHPGYVFVDDRLTRGPDAPDGSVYLGRVDPTVYPYSQVTFIRTAMDAHILPVGWQLNNAGCDKAPDIRFWEYGSTDLSGKALDTSARLSCSRQMTAAEAAWWSDPAHVLGGWSPR